MAALSADGASVSSSRITNFSEAHAGAFYALNRAWLDEHKLYEPADEKQLADPQAEILARGGAIFVALIGDRVVGTAALVPSGPGTVEIAKVTVSEAARGHGLGRRLTEHCISHARTQGYDRMVLVSSTRLGPALRLYESLGFVHRPLPEGLPYASADVYMELALGESGSDRGTRR